MLVLDPAFWFWAPLGAALLSIGLGLIVPSRDVIILTTTGSLVAALVGFVSTAFWSWLLPDGLGPDMVITAGATAWSRFAEGYAVPFMAFGATTFASLSVCRRGLRRLRASDRG